MVREPKYSSHSRSAGQKSTAVNRPTSAFKTAREKRWLVVIYVSFLIPAMIFSFLLRHFYLFTGWLSILLCLFVSFLFIVLAVKKPRFLSIVVSILLAALCYHFVTDVFSIWMGVFSFVVIYLLTIRVYKSIS